MTGTILGVWAHPDDEAYLSAGLMMRARAAGQRVVMVTASAGENGTDDPAALPPDRLAEIRRGELVASLGTLGVVESSLLGLPDGGCDGHDVSAQLEAVIDDVQPAVIVTFGPDGMTGHSDHRAISRWTTLAWTRANHRAELWYATHATEFYDTWGELNESVGIFGEQPDPPHTVEADLAAQLRLTPAELDTKLSALQAHDSQTSGLIALVGESTFREWWAVESFRAPTPAEIAEARAAVAADERSAG